MNFRYKLSIYAIIIVFGIACHRQKITYQPIAEPFAPDYALNRFEQSIQNYEKEDKQRGTSQGEILFYGSSSWVYWKTLKEDMAPLPVLNRGFGGSTIPELIHYAPRILFPYQPKMVVVYGGENDISGNKYKSPEQVYDSFRAFCSMVWKQLPQTQIIYVSMKMSPSRRKHWSDIKKANAMIATFCKGKNLGYIDINPVLFRPDGNVKSEFYTADSLHINAQGYKSYTEIIKPVLTKKYKKK